MTKKAERLRRHLLQPKATGGIRHLGLFGVLGIGLCLLPIHSSLGNSGNIAASRAELLIRLHEVEIQIEAAKTDLQRRAQHLKKIQGCQSALRASFSWTANLIHAVLRDSTTGSVEDALLKQGSRLRSRNQREHQRFKNAHYALWSLEESRREILHQLGVRTPPPTFTPQRKRWIRKRRWSN